MKFSRVFDQPVPNTIAGTGFGSVGLDVDGFIAAQQTTNPTVDEAIGEEWLTHLDQRATAMKEWLEHHAVPSQDRYLMMSLMQKGVRRRDLEAASVGAYNLLRMGRRQECVRRLHIIAMEDVGNGDPDAAALAQMMLQSTAVRKELGDVETVLMAVRLLVHAWKSRDCTDLVLWPTYDEETFEVLKGLFQNDSPTKLQSIALGMGTHSLAGRIAAMSLLKDAEKLEVAKEMKCTPSFMYSYEMSAKKSGFSFRHVAPFAALLTQNPRLSGGPYPIFRDKVHGIEAAAFDMYTAKGKSAIRIFGALAEVKKWFADHPHVKKSAILEAVFYVEGGLICPYVTHDASMDLYYSSLEAMMKKEGFTSLDEGLELYQLVLQFLPRLNRLRYSTGNDRPHDKGVL